MYKYLYVSPPSSRHDRQPDLYISLEEYPIHGLELEDRLMMGKDFTWEDLEQEAIASCSDPGTEEGRERELNEIHEKIGRGIVELLNYILHATACEVSESSTFELVESIACYECGESMIENDDGTTNHVDADGNVDYDKDADHVPYV